MDKFIKVLIIINGLLIPSIVLFATYEAFKPFYTPNQNDGIIVGNELEEAISDSLVLQGLSFGEPQAIHNSKNFYLPISIMTYEEAKSMRIAKNSAGDFAYQLQHVVNILFLDENFEVISTLLSNKASISEINIRGKSYTEQELGKDYKYLAYMIGFEDTNQDGKLNYQDEHDLFISDLEGNDLKKVSQGVEIVDYKFNEDYSKINIRYKNRTDGNIEHRKIKFAYFDIENNSWSDYTALNNKLLEIENRLIK